MSKQFESCLANQEKLKQCFFSLSTPEEKYIKVIEMGHLLAPYPKADKIPSYCVKGCQSLLYLKSSCCEGKMHFFAASEALISAGLAALLLKIYEGQSPETVLQCPPIVLQELQLANSLSPSRVNGLSSLYLRMRQDAVQFLQETA